MSSSLSLFYRTQTPTSLQHSPSDDLYNIERRLSYHTQHSFDLPQHLQSTKPLAQAHDQTKDVIAARSNSCMQLNFDPAKVVFPPQNQWETVIEHHSSTDDLSGWRAPASYIPRSVQSTYPAVSEAWSMQSFASDGNSMGMTAVTPLDGLKRQNSSHQRASSTSTIASNGPASPYSYTSSNPHIANTEVPPFDHAIDLAKDNLASQHATTNPAYLSANYLPAYLSQRAHSGQRFYNFAQDYSTHHSMSHADHTSPSTPSSVSEEVDARQNNGLRRPNDGESRTLQPQLQLLRTESAAYQDELYNPANFTAMSTSAAKPARPQVTTPAPRTLVNQYLESANMARSASPNSAVSRERSPFREGSELAPSEVWSSPKNPIQTAASRRQQMKLEREQAEMAAHRPQLQREPTKTISPKDALLDYNEDAPPLIQDVVPAGYKQHLGGSEPYTTTAADGSSTLKNASFNLPTTSSHQTSDNSNMAGFRAASGDAFTTPSFNFSPPASQQNAQAMQNPFQMGAYQHLVHLDPSYGGVSLAEPTPQFPATLTSMESSISDQTPALSSQDSNITSIPRPADTRANTGTYTCTYHGCAQRFDSPALLQRHKREYHRAQQQQQQQQTRENLSVEASSESPRSTASPGPAGSGLTSAQILARNSQAGPHKCTRTNPSTGKPCNTVFSRPYDLTRHEDTIHNGRKHKVRCPYCREEKTFSRNDALTRHMRVVHPDVENYGKRARRGD